MDRFGKAEKECVADDFLVSEYYRIGSNSHLCSQAERPGFHSRAAICNDNIRQEYYLEVSGTYTMVKH